MTNKKILPRIVVVGVQALLHKHCASFQHLVSRHPWNLWQIDQLRGLPHPIKEINFSFMTYQNNLTQNRLCRSTGSCAYALCKFSAAVATSVSWPMKPLANWRAAGVLHPGKNQFLSWLLRKNLPRIVVVFPRACFQLVIELHHQEALWQRYQPRGPMHPLKKSISLLWVMRKVSPRIVVLFPQACFRIVQLVSQFRHRRNGWLRHEQHLQPIDAE